MTVSIIKQIGKVLIKQNLFSFILTFYFLLVLFITLPYSYIINSFDIEYIENPAIQNLDYISLILFSLFFAPIIETLIFQILIINLALYFSKDNYIFASFISALLFGLSHYFNITYVVVTFLGGLVFGLVYYYSIRKKIEPFIPIASIHFLYNLTGLLLL